MKKNNRLIASVAALATLALLAGCTAAAAVGETNPVNENITLEQAAVIAYTHAGVDESKAIDKSYERDRDHYEIDFEFGGYEYEYDISLTGAILHSYKERDDGIRETQPTAAQPVETQPVETQPIETQPAPTEAKNITLEEAKAIAFQHAGVQESQITDKSLEKDDGRYEIDFDYNGYEYEYDISFEGKILNSRKEKDDDRQPTVTEPKATEPKPTESKPKTITLEEAKDIAFQHASVKESQVTDKSFERDDGIYEIDFDYNGYEYEYDISLEGKILKSHKEKDDDHHQGHHKQEQTEQEERISADKALSIALNHAGVSKSDTREREVEWDDGCWEVSFEVGRTEYDYKISAAGKVLRHEKETD